MNFGLQINRFDFPGGTPAIAKNVRAVAQAAEGAGFYSVWVMDHFFQLPGLGPKDDPMMEAYTTLGYLAGVTEKVKLGTLVTGVIYREPAVLINAVTTLDVLSSGRAYFGIGAGWNEEEAIALGLPNPLTSQRFHKLEDILKLSKQMWAGDRSPFKGKAYELPEPINVPGPVTKPHPPIMVGGSGEQKTLRLVAEYGDACNLFGRTGLDGNKHKLDVLRQHCTDVGRNYDDIEKTVLAGVRIDDAAADPDCLKKLADEWGELGITHIILAVSNTANLKAYDKVADQLAKL
jgi:F420-dependent oxidoreductase-like protein